MLRSSKTLLVTVLAGAAGLFGNATVATAQQPLTVNVTASAPRAQGEPTVILSTFTDEEGSWNRVPRRELWNTGPRYTERSGVRIGRGSVIPDWVETAPMRNVSIRRLQRMEHYGYFVSPETKSSCSLQTTGAWLSSCADVPRQIAAERTASRRPSVLRARATRSRGCSKMPSLWPLRMPTRRGWLAISAAKLGGCPHRSLCIGIWHLSPIRWHPLISMPRRVRLTRGRRSPPSRVAAA